MYHVRITLRGLDCIEMTAQLLGYIASSPARGTILRMSNKQPSKGFAAGSSQLLYLHRVNDSSRYMLAKTLCLLALLAALDWSSDRRERQPGGHTIGDRAPGYHYLGKKTINRRKTLSLLSESRDEPLRHRE